MSFSSLHDFLYMGGHWVEVWLAYAIGVVVLVANVLRPVLVRRRFFAEEIRRRRRLSTGETNRAPGTP